MITLPIEAAVSVNRRGGLKQKKEFAFAGEKMQVLRQYYAYTPGTDIDKFLGTRSERQQATTLAFENSAAP
jgi:hypothetical protein